MTTGILQKKLMLIQEEYPGSKTNKEDPPFSVWSEHQKRVLTKFFIVGE